MTLLAPAIGQMELLDAALKDAAPEALTPQALLQQLRPGQWLHRRQLHRGDDRGLRGQDAHPRWLELRGQRQPVVQHLRDAPGVQLHRHGHRGRLLYRGSHQRKHLLGGTDLRRRWPDFQQRRQPHGHSQDHALLGVGRGHAALPAEHWICPLQSCCG